MDVVHFEGSFHSCFRNGFIDGEDAAVLVIEHQLDGTAGGLGAVVAGGGNTPPVVKLPVQAGPGAVEHPLNNAGCIGHIAAESLVHGALGIVVQGMRLTHIVL